MLNDFHARSSRAQAGQVAAWASRAAHCAGVPSSKMLSRSLQVTFIECHRTNSIPEPSPCSFTAARSLEHCAKIFLGLEKCVLRGGFGNLQHLGDFRMMETLDLVEQKNVALVASQLGQRAFEGESQRGMRARCARLGVQRLAGFVFVRHLLFAEAFAASIVARIDQNAEGPRDKARLTTKAADTALDLQKGLLNRVLSVERVAEQVAGEIPHARALQRVKALVRLQVPRLAGCSQRGVFGPRRVHGRVDAGGDSGFTERFHSPLPVARYGRDSMLPGQCKSHCSHAMLLEDRRW